MRGGCGRVDKGGLGTHSALAPAAKGFCIVGKRSRWVSLWRPIANDLSGRRMPICSRDATGSWYTVLRYTGKTLRLNRNTRDSGAPLLGRGQLSVRNPGNGHQTLGFQGRHEDPRQDIHSTIWLAHMFCFDDSSPEDLPSTAEKNR